jgi:hypothetical protein
MTRAEALLGRRAWRRLERNAVRCHERELLEKLRILSAARQTVEDAVPAVDLRSLSFRLAGRRLILGGVSPAAAGETLEMASRGRLRLLGCGRYGRYWWVALGDEDHQVTLASHLQLLGEPGRSADRPALRRGPTATLRA